jgi:hypothetical protein
VSAPAGDGRRRISVELPEHLVDWIDSLRSEWGLRGRGDCLTRLLEEVFPAVGEDELPSQADLLPEPNEPGAYRDDRALVLIGGHRLRPVEGDASADGGEPILPVESETRSGIDLPGFVRRKSRDLRESLRHEPEPTESLEEVMVLPAIDSSHLQRCAQLAQTHWVSLYGQAPGDTVLEAAMLWLARDIWPQTEGLEGRIFTWSELGRQFQTRCPGWLLAEPSFPQVMVVAGVMEDPFATSDLHNRIPTLIRRFVNRFKRSRRITSFETLESTMTVHGALRLLGLPTQAGASLTLRSIRDAYKQQAMQSHPDAGGSTDGMRRLNEAYQMLRELYRNR